MSKIVALAMLLIGVLIVFITFGFDLVLRSKIGSENLGMGLFFAGFVPLSIGMLVNPTIWRSKRAVGDPTAHLTITTPWTMVAGILLGCLLMGSSCAYVLTSGPSDSTERGWAIAGLIVFWGAALAAVFLRQTTSLKLAPDGLEYTAFRCGPIAWPDISAVEVDYVLRSYVVALHVRDEEKYFKRGFKRVGMRWGWTRRIASSPFSIPSAMFNLPPEWLRRAIQTRLDHFGGPSNLSFATVQRQGTTA